MVSVFLFCISLCIGELEHHFIFLLTILLWMNLLEIIENYWLVYTHKLNLLERYWLFYIIQRGGRTGKPWGKWTRAAFRPHQQGLQTLFLWFSSNNSWVLWFLIQNSKLSEFTQAQLWLGFQGYMAQIWVLGSFPVLSVFSPERASLTAATSCISLVFIFPFSVDSFFKLICKNSLCFRDMRSLSFVF